MPDPQKTLDELRGICLALPNTKEVEAWGHPTFRVGDKIFASMGESKEGDLCIGFKATVAEQKILCADPRFRPSDYVGRHGWTTLVARGRIRWKEVEELVHRSFRHIAPKKLVKELDGE